VSDFIFDLPLIISGPLIIFSLAGVGLAGLFAVRRYLLPHLRIKSKDAEFTGALVQCVMVFYGLSAGLIAVSVFETYSDVSRVTAAESTALASLYRDVSGYPQPTRERLQGKLADYTKFVIDEAWPLQRTGEIPTGGVGLMYAFQGELIAFEPATEGQKVLHYETLAAYNRMIVVRNARLESVRTALPGVMWVVVILGAAISLTPSFFFKVEDARLHAILVGLLAMFIGLVIFMILAFDRPFRGDLGIGPEPYQLIYEQLMKK
jgi:hypothetical protein